MTKRDINIVKHLKPIVKQKERDLKYEGRLSALTKVQKLHTAFGEEVYGLDICDALGLANRIKRKGN